MVIMSKKVHIPKRGNKMEYTGLYLLSASFLSWEISIPLRITDPWPYTQDLYGENTSPVFLKPKIYVEIGKYISKILSFGSY